MEWSEYLERIQSAEYRYNVPALFAEADTFEAFIQDFVDPLDPDTVDRVAAIDALGFIPGACVARELDAGLITVRKGGKLPIDEEYLISDTLVDYTGQEKTLELDIRRVPDGAQILVVDDWVETASQMSTAISLLELAGGEIAGIAVLGAEENDITRDLDERYGLYSVRPWRELGEPER